ncbi:heme ABC transporter ATP-binding protein [Shewanella fidelis]|uniref:Heme ABC transporter ATP-binding protein n=1 Tax=Shewanella fidelis TaxID=173509 RepID=A0AAW8NL37_9GAMM|nr:heme ABC transporter ATP-binding protein [Shewanella fidelis]MDR8522618.1 heme ABC transporter ATP-binding protein [Shewanella fidelis]MDW4812234.1 heme ABC transporter ATP-binding protein [Shewanella fidelis]MDW4816102.1 heme ABC transporter ATP-binding protein [Shewanella fidelis]MDW4820475.1 heme ABC transporter ATP-binding protein [Shewanella fidelis]MDW4824697.1 heme ABC transporter ATP-binding protein [Shewanella fidelis]
MQTDSLTPVLEVNRLSVRIGHKPVLTDINLKLQPGQVTALLGPNGAGKSTLLKSFCQEVALDAGEIKVYGKNVNSWDRQQLAKSLAVLPQHASLTFPFKVREVVEMGLYPLTLNQQQGKRLVGEQLEQVALAHLKERSYPTLSGGEKQRVQLARVLTQLAQSERPAILLLDEPTSALDLAQQHRVLALARSLAHEQNYAVIVVLHDLNQASRYADRLVVLENGCIVSDGKPSDTLTPETIRQVWHYDPVVVMEPGKQTPLLF